MFVNIVSLLKESRNWQIHSIPYHKRAPILPLWQKYRLNLANVWCSQPKTPNCMVYKGRQGIVLLCYFSCISSYVKISTCCKHIQLVRSQQVSGDGTKPRHTHMLAFKRLTYAYVLFFQRKIQSNNGYTANIQISLFVMHWTNHIQIR